MIKLDPCSRSRGAYVRPLEPDWRGTVGVGWGGGGASVLPLGDVREVFVCGFLDGMSD